MQPHHLTTERHGFGEECRVGGQGHTEARTDEICRETGREGGMRHHGGEIRHHVLGRDRLAISGRELCQERGADIRVR